MRSIVLTIVSRNPHLHVFDRRPKCSADAEVFEGNNLLLSDCNPSIHLYLQRPVRHYPQSLHQRKIRDPRPEKRPQTFPSYRQGSSQ